MRNWKKLFRDPDKIRAWLEVCSTIATLIIRAIHYFVK
jgi:hypothetical protein